MEMLLKRIGVAALILTVASYAFAQIGTGKSKSALQTELNNCFPTQLTGAITPASALLCYSDMLASWQQFPNVNAQVGSSYAFVANDYGKLVTFSNSGSVSVTLSAPSVSGFNPWNVYVANLGAGTVTVTASGATINGSSTLQVATGNSYWIVSDGTNYQLWGGIPSTIGSLTISGTLTVGGTIIDTSGGLAIGSPSGGSKGSGTVNAATSYYINGNQVETLTAVSSPLVFANGGLSLTPTGFGLAVLQNSPTLISPVLGVATATSINFGGNALSTYTTGTWTPVITGTGTAGAFTYSSQVGNYTQIGREVVAYFSLQTTAAGVSPTGNLTITGLPVANNSSISGTCVMNVVNGWTSAGFSMVAGQIGVSVSTVSLTESGTGQSAGSSAASHWAFTAFNIQGFCRYHT